MRIPKPFSSDLVGSPPFSPQDSTSVSKNEFASMKSPVSSTPMILKKKASFKLPLTTEAATKARSNVCLLSESAFSKHFQYLMDLAKDSVANAVLRSSAPYEKYYSFASYKQ